MVVYSMRNKMEEKSLRFAYKTGLIAYMLMGVLALYFYKERTILLDASYALFHLLRENSFSIEFHRFPDAVVQTLPLIASRLGWSLTTIMKLYSVSFVGVYFLCYFITGSLLKRHDLALVMLMVNSAFVTETFFYTPSQLPQGICFLIMLFAGLSRIKNRAGDEVRHAEQFFFTLTGMTVLAFFHPLMLFPLAYLAAFFYLRQDPVKGKEVFVVMMGGFVAVVVLKSALFHTKYERESLSGLKNFYVHFPHYVMLYSNKIFLQYCCGRYIWIPVLLVANLYTYFRQSEKLKLALLLFGFFGYLLLINITYPDKTTPGFYRENLYLPLSFMLALPFVYDALPLLAKPKIAVALVTAMVAMFFVRVIVNHPIYTARVNWLRQTAHKYADGKLVLDLRNAPKDTLQMVWGTPYEVWLLSSSEMGKVVSVFVDKKPDDHLWLKGVTKGYYVNWDMYEYSSFPKNKYFVFTDTIHGYNKLDTIAIKHLEYRKDSVKSFFKMQ